MKAQLLREKRTGALWVFVPEQHIRFRTDERGPHGLSLFASQTNIPRKHGLVGEMSDAERTLRTTEQVGIIDIPNEMVLFAQFWIEAKTKFLEKDLVRLFSSLDRALGSRPPLEPVPWKTKLSDDALLYLEYLAARELKRLIDECGSR